MKRKRVQSGGDEENTEIIRRDDANADDGEKDSDTEKNEEVDVETD